MPAIYGLFLFTGRLPGISTQFRSAKATTETGSKQTPFHVKYCTIAP